jgi:hypothetical protein
MIENDQNQVKNTESRSLSKRRSSEMHKARCNRGIDLIVWLKTVSLGETCLCSRTFYGKQCEYENERILLSIEFGALASSREIPFGIVILLRDDQRRIHSSEQITYLSLKYCQMKFNFYLIYFNRSKDLRRKYFIQIDI